MKGYLGIDTSCYTTSVALFGEDGSLVADKRRLLRVKLSECGLQQQEMVFQHTRVLPDLVADALTDRPEIAAICVSGSPRPSKDSYMPAFLVGLGTAKSLSSCIGCPLMVQSHQENHLQAGLWSCGTLIKEKFLLLHASGGTTEILFVQRNDTGYLLKSVGGSIDLHAGQFVDRVGVAFGLQFPAGSELEKLAEKANTSVKLPVSVRQTQISFSGPATAALKLLATGVDRAQLALGVECCIGVSFGRALCSASEIYDVNDVLVVGGVGANRGVNSVCRNILAKRGIRLHCTQKDYSKDGAVGNAYTAWYTFCENSVNTGRM